MLLNRYAIGPVIGKGSYGVVMAATDIFTNEQVAIKHVDNVFENPGDCIRIVRELKLVRMINHVNIVSLRNVIQSDDRRSVYMVFNRMDSDLHQARHKLRTLQPTQHVVTLYQILHGLAHMHACGVMHRDLKPSNILINNDMTVKIADFGMARPRSLAPGPIMWSDYVSTRWYRAPEVCGCFYGTYTDKIDMWAVGCIYAELILGQPLFQGTDVVHQLVMMINMLGTPEDSVVANISNKKARDFIKSYPHRKPMDMSTVFTRSTQEELSMLTALLSFDPDKRPSAADALMMPLFKYMPAIGKVNVPFSKIVANYISSEIDKCNVFNMHAMVASEAAMYV
jgi:serine/threonine protein kinase